MTRLGAAFRAIGGTPNYRPFQLAKPRTEHHVARGTSGFYDVVRQFEYPRARKEEVENDSRFTFASRATEVGLFRGVRVGPEGLPDNHHSSPTRRRGRRNRPPYLWGLAAVGQAGVEAVLTILRRELEMVMRQAGTTTIGRIGRDQIVDARG